MPAETNDGDYNIEDEDTSDEGDTVRPPAYPNRDTPVDLTLESVQAMQRGRVRIRDLSRVSRRDEILLRIGSGVSKAHIRATKMSYDPNQQLAFAEYRSLGESTVYVYTSKSHEGDILVRFAGREMWIPKPRGSVLLKVTPEKHKAEVIHKWFD